MRQLFQKFRICFNLTAERSSLEDAEATFVADFPIGRLIEPGDIAPMVLFLASPHAAAITGQAIGVDGGSSPDVSY